jgi:hypothetical protein
LRAALAIHRFNSTRLIAYAPGEVRWVEHMDFFVVRDIDPALWFSVVTAVRVDTEPIRLAHHLATDSEWSQDQNGPVRLPHHVLCPDEFNDGLSESAVGGEQGSTEA